MPSVQSSVRLTVLLSLGLALAACGKSADNGSDTVALQNMEVVDGTTSDAMTDLDGVRAEGTATVATPASNATATATPAPAENAANAAPADDEVVAEQ